MTRITRQIDLFAGKEHCDLGRRISSYHSVQKFASLDSKWRPRYKSSTYASQKPTTLDQNKNRMFTSLKSKSTSPSHSPARLITSKKSENVEPSRQLATAGRKRSRHSRNKLPLRLRGINAPDSQCTASSAVTPENTTHETQKIKPREKGLFQQRTAVRKHVEHGKQNIDDGQELAPVKAPTTADNGPPCYHLLLEKLDLDRMRGY